MAGNWSRKLSWLACFEDGVGLGDGRAVDVELAALQVDTVAGEADDALDDVVGGVEREVEDDDVAALDGLVGQQPATSARGAVDGFVDEEEVADEQGALHGLRRNAEGLHDEGEHEESDDDDAEERAERLPAGRGRRRGDAWWAAGAGGDDGVGPGCGSAMSLACCS